MSAYGVQAHPDATKAFMVTDEDRALGSVIVWARNYFEAKRHGAQALDSEYECVGAERFPKLDGFEGDLLAWLLDDGWCFPCAQCENICYGGTDGCLRDEDDIFCGEACRDRYRTSWGAKRALEQRFREFAEVKFFGLCPRFYLVNVGEEALFWIGAGVERRDQVLGHIERSELGL